MIVRKETDGSLVLITQTNHAELSGTLAANWGNETFARPRPFQSVVRAAIYHDAGWYRYETKPSYDLANKTSPNFLQVSTDASQLAAYQWAIDWLTDIDPYAGLLISRHRTGLWNERYKVLSKPPMRSRRPFPPKVEEFVTRNEAQQDEALTSLNRAEFDLNYHNLQVWDLLSLYLCTAAAPQSQAIEPVPTQYGGGAGVAMTVEPRGEDRIAITPYPFTPRSLRVCYTYKRLPTSDFPSEAAFLDAYYAAEYATRYFEFV